MNILVPYKALNNIVKTNLTIEKIAELITLRSSSVEKIDTIENDAVFDIEITPNRGDNLSVLGIAREFYAICEAENIEATFNDPSMGSGHVPSISTDQKKVLNITIEDKELCPRFTAIVVDNIKITESPEYIQTFLKQVGMRPINNIVDLTNYIMILTGQPMHAFDYNKISRNVMNVRASKPGEKIITLDGVERELPENSVVINDAERIIDLCGIMGGENSAIDTNTKTVVLFTQIYDKYRLRKTSLALNHRTEAVLRFEKGIDPLLQDKALYKSLEVLKESTNYDVVSEVYDINQTDTKDITVEMKYAKLYKIANFKLPITDCENILRALGFTVLENTTEKIVVGVPSFRIHDVSIEEDLVEEVIRIYGYEKIGLELPKNNFDFGIFDNTNKVERLLKSHLKSTGFNELLTISMVSKDKVNLKTAVKIDNPLGIDMEYMRTSQEPILNESIANNRGDIMIFELSKVYKKNGEKMPLELKKLGLLANGENNEEKVLNTIKNIFKILQILNYRLQIGKSQIGIVINKKLSGKIYIRENYTFVEILFKNLVKNYSSYPDIKDEFNTNIISEDLTIHTPIDSIFGIIADKVKKLDERILSVQFLDSYIKENNRALTINLKFQDKDKNLEEDEVKALRDKIIDFLENKNTIKYTVDKPASY